MVRQSIIIKPNTEVIIPVCPVIVHKHSSNLHPKVSQLGMRLLEPCLTSYLPQKGLYVARTLVDVNEDRVAPLLVFNVSEEVFNLATKTVVALAKPVIEVTSLELYEESQESIGDQHSMKFQIYASVKIPEILRKESLYGAIRPPLQVRTELIYA